MIEISPSSAVSAPTSRPGDGIGGPDGRGIGGSRFNLRLALIAAAGAGLGAAVGVACGAPVWAAAVLLAVLAPVSVVDLRHRIVPNKLVAVGMLAALLGAALADASSLSERAVAAVAAGAFLGVPALVAPEAIGMGDAKLAALLGAFLGAGVAIALAAGLLVATLVGVGIAARRGVRSARRTTLPLAPFLAGGAIVAVALGTMPR